MSGRMSKSKGYRGETEVKSILERLMAIVFQEMGLPMAALPELSRSPNGRDLVGLPWIAVEVKRHERDNPFVVNEWWTQCKNQAEGKREPVLFYRMNNRPWNIRMFGYLDAGSGRVRCPVDIGLEAFSAWFCARYKANLQK